MRNDVPWAKGPWETNPSLGLMEEREGVGVYTIDGQGDLDIHRLSANARLIEAAPKMADTLERVDEVLTEYGGCTMPPVVWSSLCKMVRTTLRAAGHPDYQEDQ